MSVDHVVGPACPTCSTTNRVDAKFCRGCGNALRPAADAAATPPADTPEGEGAAAAASSPAETAAAPVQEVAAVPAEEAPAGDAPAAVPAMPASPLTRRVVRVRLLVLAVVVIAAVVAGVVFFSTQKTGDRDPREPVTAFFDALQRRDMARIGEVVGESSSPLLAAGALAEGYVPPGAVKVGDVTYGEADEKTKRPNRNIARVQVEYLLGENTYTSVVTLSRAANGVARSWHILSGAGVYLDVVSPTVKQARVAAATVETVPVARQGRGTDGAVLAVPGVYTITMGDDPLWQTDVEVDVTPEADTATTSVELPLTATPAATAEVTRQIRARITTCAKERTLSPEVAAGRCPFDLNRFVYPTPTDVRWRVTAYPTVEVVPSDEPLVDGGPATARTTKKGQASVSYSDGEEKLTETVEIDPGGVVELVAGRVTWRG